METKSLKEIYNDICIQIAENWQSSQKSAVPVAHFAKVIGTSIPAMKGMLRRCPSMVEVLPDFYTLSQYVVA